MIKIETYIDKQKKNVYKGKAHYGGVWIRRLRFLAFFFFFFHVFQGVMWLLFMNSSRKGWLFHGEQCTRALFTNPQIPLFSNFFIKNGSHGTIHTFKSYFAIVFSVLVISFSKNKLNPNRLFVLNIKKNKSNTSRGSSNEENNVMRTRSETLLSNNWAKLFKPSLRSLFKAIKSTVKATNSTAWVSTARGWLHIHFFLEVSIKESILHIHLMKRPMANGSHSNDTSDRCKASNRSKCFLIVNAIFLSKAIGN